MSAGGRDAGHRLAVRVVEPSEGGGAKLDGGCVTPSAPSRGEGNGMMTLSRAPRVGVCSQDADSLWWGASS